MSRVSKVVSDAVYRRDDYRCVSCGATGGLSLQHRKNAGMGGSKFLHTPSNLIVMCVYENVALESDADFAQVGRFNGWKLGSSADPLGEPVFYPLLGKSFYLDDVGGRVESDYAPF